MTQMRIAEYQEDAPRQTYRLRVGLWLLDALVIGGLIALLITANLMNRMSDVYAAHNNLSQTMAFSLLLDELYPYHLGYIFGSQILLAITVAVELWTRLKRWKLQHGAHSLANN